MAPSDDGGPLVSVLIVNFNGRHHLAECLQALRRQSLPAHLWETILIDNGSHDGSCEFVARQFPSVRIIALDGNTGFASGNNIGLRHARGQFIALLNNDTSAHLDWLRAMLTTLQQHPEAGGVACKILFHHDPTLLNSAGLQLLRDGRGADRGFRQRDEGQFDQPGDVFGACGAAMLLRRMMLDDVGFFDDRLFMYYEDLDLCWRARRRGWKFVYEPAAVVRHVHCGSSSEASPFFCFHVERNRVLVNLKNNTPMLALLVLIGFLARAARCWFRIIRSGNRGAWQTAHGMAFLRAAGSIAFWLPVLLAERLRPVPGRRPMCETESTESIQPAARAA